MKKHISAILMICSLCLVTSCNSGSDWQKAEHTPTLTALMKEELGCTAIEYLMKYRITVAEKQLEFTSVPIKDIANMLGFKTVQHFSRVFKAQTGTTPAEFRKSAMQKRKDDFK